MIVIQKIAMRKLRILFILLLSGCLLSGSAKTMRELWVSMPDSLISYLNADQRQAMLNFMGMGLKGDASNSFGGQCVVDSLTDDYLHVVLSERSELAVKRLPALQGDSVVCVIRTWSAPEKESSAFIYTQDWQLAGPAVDASADLRRRLIVCPDTMPKPDFERLLSQIDFSMVSLRMDAGTSNLLAALSVPSVEKSIKEALRPMVRLTTLKWNGITFK